MAKSKAVEWLTPYGLLKIGGWAKDGLTDEQIAHNIGISRSTLSEWKNKYPDIADTLKNNKQVADRMVENALFERALGGVHQLKKTFKVRESYYDENGKKCEREVLKTGIDEIYTPGDTLAQIFWLKNRKPEQWREKQQDVQDTSAVDRLDKILKEVRDNAVKQKAE